jgi:CheY-like chemotaxis protein
MTKSTPPPKSIILYADDDIDDLQLVEEAFTNYSSNVEVITATDGIKALRYLKDITSSDAKPCLVILDINMPRMSGKEVLVEIRKTAELKDTPVVLFSTSSLQQDIEFAKRHEAGFITKPIDARQMEIIADQFIEHCTEEIQRHIRNNFK